MSGRTWLKWAVAKNLPLTGFFRKALLAKAIITGV
jgi:hypothetical protein